MALDSEWLELAKVGVSALTPLVTGLVGVFIVRLGHRMEGAKQLHQELLKKRLDVYEEVAPQLNDIYCFFQAIGHWAELRPDDIIKRKRSVDRILQVHRFLFGPPMWTAYQTFELSHFDLYSRVGEAALMRLDMPYIRERLGDHFNTDWLPSVSSKVGDQAEQARNYKKLMDLLGEEVRGDQ